MGGNDITIEYLINKSKRLSMTDFERIYSNLIEFEGGYSNDPDDSGAETYKGISRKFHPHNPIWNIIDAHKNEWNFMPFLETSPELHKLVKEFYYTWYTRNNIDKLYCFELKRKLFLTEIIIGEIKANRILQTCYNELKRAIVLCNDGIIGPKSIKALNSLRKKPDQESILEKDLMRYYIGELYIYYKKLTERRPKDKKFFKGWVRRAFS